ncbi:hypothetical protein CPAV1605_282 [seawater metagenome]|uniref:Uncharacterized protein n=1 Tax=seawater metagenome TaxID=1561972 RepID=A0A5E8CHM7_9ZZZZ
MSLELRRQIDDTLKLNLSINNETEFNLTKVDKKTYRLFDKNKILVLTAILKKKNFEIFYFGKHVATLNIEKEIYGVRKYVLYYQDPKHKKILGIIRHNNYTIKVYIPTLSTVTNSVCNFYNSNNPINKITLFKSKQSNFSNDLIQSKKNYLLEEDGNEITEFYKIDKKEFKLKSYKVVSILQSFSIALSSIYSKSGRFRM